MKMGLRLALLHDDWDSFVESYNKVLKTSDILFNVSVSPEEKERDLDNFRQLREIIIKYDLVHDTVVKLNDEIKKGKRILVEDCSSSTMDIDTGIYPYVDSFHTTSGAVCTGLGVPEEVIETTIGVFSAITVLDKAFLSNVEKFPTRIEHNQYIQDGLKNDYLLPEEDYAFGWTDLNLLNHAERINKLSSVFLTHLDLLDDLEEIKVCTGY
jgi:adenylosuccinate synthase